MSKYPWLKLRKKTDPEYPLEPPLWFGNQSNGEYFQPQTKRDAAMRKEILRRADEKARYLGMDRREFLVSSMGMFTTMAVINEMGCSNGDGSPVGVGSDGGNGDGSGSLYDFSGGRPYVVPPEADCDPGMEAYLKGDEFIMDVQTHCFDDGEWREKQVAYPIFLSFIASCPDEANQLDCVNEKHYAEQMFLDSDTTVAVITSWPAAECFEDRSIVGHEPTACGLPLSNASMRELRDWLNGIAKSQRLINQVQVMPNDKLERQLEGMYAAMEDPNWRLGSWKAYPAWRSDTYPDANGYANGYFLTDPIGRAFIEAGLRLGVPNFAIHKGLPIPGFNVEHNKPTDIGPVARDYPEANFVIYHSAISAGTGGDAVSALSPTVTEDVPYDPNDPNPLGVNMLLRSLIDHGVILDPDSPNTAVTPNARLNVFAEMGSAWARVMRDPNQAQHYIGKLLKYLGEDNIVWGTDCILGGSPQGQIELFRSFTITPEYQERFGYPELTPQAKRKIFGLNAARIYRVDPDSARCTFDRGALAMMKRDTDANLGDRRWALRPPKGPRTWREFWNHAKIERAKGVPG
jgi:uncharacterized protein